MEVVEQEIKFQSLFEYETLNAFGHQVEPNASTFYVRMPFLSNTKELSIDTELILDWKELAKKEAKEKKGKTAFQDIAENEAKRRRLAGTR